MQLVPQFYDENWRNSVDLKYEKVNVGKLMKKKKKVIISGTEPTLSSKARILSTQCGGVLQGATLLILAQLHRRLAHPFP